jgi:hypothetical protein
LPLPPTAWRGRPLSGAKRPHRKRGPSTWTGTAASADEVSAAIAPNLALMPSSQVHIQMEWPDGGHQLGQRVRVTLTYTQHLICGDLLGLQPWQMTAVSVMRIQH